jgi:Secretion system C-terminal sorting domain
MKKMFAPIFLITVMFLCIAPSKIFAFPADTVVVSALPPGNLNNVINSDTTSAGFVKPNTVFVLKPMGALDTVYWMTAPVTVKGSVTLIGHNNPTTGHPPVVAPSIASDNSSIGNFFSPQGNDTLTLRGIYFIGTRTDSLSSTGRFIVPAEDSDVYIFDHCILENISGAGTPNLFDTYNHDHESFYVTNCEFRNNQDDNPQNPGFAWVDPGTYPCDTAIFKNNTFFLTGGYILGSSGYGCTYLDFEHNTIFFSGQGGAFDLYQMTNSIIKNNIFFSVSSAAYPVSWYNNTPGSWGSAVIPLDSLSSLKAAPYNLTEAQRHITITNNAYFWPQQIVNMWTQLNTDTAGISSVTPLRPPDFINTQPGMLTDKTTWPNINVANNNSMDPGFNSSLVQMAGSKMAAFVDTLWHHNQTAAGVRPYVYPLYDPPTWDGVASDWAAVQGYPVPENLKYSADLKGSDGLPLGDLNWFPGVTGIKQMPSGIPTKFNLSQNYPNPFNPSTQIQYSISQNSFVTLKVYNILGQEVATLVNQRQISGTYNVEFNASNLASGVYLYTIRAGNFYLTKKMVLLK